jgi:hypothetical protein
MSGIVVPPPPTTPASLDLERSLEYIQARIERYEGLRRLAYESQKLHKAKIFENAQQIKTALDNIKASQESLQKAGKIITIGAICLVAIEFAAGALAGVKWLMNRWTGGQVTVIGEETHLKGSGKLSNHSAGRLHPRDCRLNVIQELVL